MTQACNMLWIGPSLSRLERACMRSVLRQGHSLRLWCYAEPAGVPRGVVTADASVILPEERIVRHHTGSVSLFSNWFRYELQRQGKGIWLDSDIYLLKPIPDSELLLTMCDERWISSAPLCLPPDSPILPPLLDLFEAPCVPAWLHWRPKLAARWRAIVTGRVDLSKMTWGIAGPQAVTEMARRHGVAHLASPPATYHPFHWQEAEWVVDPCHTLEQRVTEETVGVHLWNECIKAFKERPAPSGTFLARLQNEGR